MRMLQSQSSCRVYWFAVTMKKKRNTRETGKKKTKGASFACNHIGLNPISEQVEEEGQQATVNKAHLEMFNVFFLIGKL